MPFKIQINENLIYEFSVYALVFTCHSFVMCSWKLCGVYGGKNNKCLDMKQCCEEIQGDIDRNFRQYLESYGDITDVVIMFDQTTNRPRGFGFISFDISDDVDRVLQIQEIFHEPNNRFVEVKRALPKDDIHGSNFG